MRVVCADHVDVAVPVENVFAFVTDISRWPVWISSVVSAQHPQAKPVALDEELLLCLHAGRKRWHEHFEVTRFVQNAFLSLEGAYSAARRIDFRFEQRGTQTRVGCAIGYPLFGGFILRWLDSISRRRRVRREVRDSLSRLKGLLEERGESPTVDDSLYDEAVAASAARPASPLHEPAGVI
jgi:uncharacterized membrane protein